jgi:hypothetical protein
MTKMRFAPAGSIQAVRLTIAAVVVAGLLAVGLISGPATASATGSTHVTSCSNGVQIVCLGTISGNPITVDVGNINVLSGNDVKAELENVLNNNANISDIQVQVDKVASDFVIKLENVLNVHICQVKVVELGFVNLNLAKCN